MIPSMENAKGIVEANYSTKTGLSKLTGAPGAMKEKITSRIDAWFDKPQKAPVADKARVIGYGWDSAPRA